MRRGCCMWCSRRPRLRCRTRRLWMRSRRCSRFRCRTRRRRWMRSHGCSRFGRRTRRGSRMRRNRCSRFGNRSGRGRRMGRGRRSLLWCGACFIRRARRRYRSLLGRRTGRISSRPIVHGRARIRSRRGRYGPRRSHDCGPSVICRCQLSPVCTGGTFVGHLLGRCLHMPLLCGRGLLRRRPCSNTASPVEARPAVGDYVVIDDIPVGVVNDSRIHLCDGRVVRELSAPPLTSEKPNSTIAEAVVNATVEADGRSPVAGIKGVNSVHEAPPRRCPQQADLRRRHPDSRYPVITRIPVSPIAGIPKVSIDRTRRLHVNRQCRRCDRDRHRYARGGCRWRP
jgi:hypothetical protein